MHSFFDELLFQTQLQETILWCTQQLNVSTEAEVLRTLLPRPDNLEEMYRSPALDTFARQVFAERRKRLSTSLKPSKSDKINLQDGSLIVFLADHACAWDGVAEVESNGYFDFFEYPPWDCWIYYVSRNEMKLAGLDKASTHMIAWVPAQFLAAVEVAIRFNADPALMTLGNAIEVFPYLTAVNLLVE